MLLGAGRGTRLAKLGLNVPKILVEVDGEPLLARQIRYLSGQGVTRIVLNTHYLADQVQAFARQHTGAPELRIVHEPSLLGTAGGVRNALQQLGAEPFLVLYGDVITDVALAPILASHRRHHATQATLAVYASEETEDKGTVEVDGSDRVVGFREKAFDVRAGLVNAGIYVLEPRLVRELVAAGEVSDFGHDVFPCALKRGLRLQAFHLDGPVLDIGTPANLDQAKSL